MNWSTVAKVGVGLLAGYQVSRLSFDENADRLLRPPGAGEESDFMSKCIRCGKCIQACPYDTLFPAGEETGAAVGTPTFDARENACKLCKDLPCTKVCPTGALSELDDIREVDIGLARINTDLCIALKGIRCEVCYRACPLIDEAITINYYVREGDSIHTIFEPVIDLDVCTGCGLCVERCVIDSPRTAIEIEPVMKREGRQQTNTRYDYQEQLNENQDINFG